MPDLTHPLNRTQALHILEHLPDALAVVDTRQIVRYLNQAAYQALAIDQLPADSTLDVLTTETGLHAIPLPDAPTGLQVFRLEPGPQAVASIHQGGDLVTLFESLSIGMFMLDAHNRVIATNRTAEMLVGKSSIAMLRHEISWLLPGLNPHHLRPGSTGQMPEFEHNHRRFIARLLTSPTYRILAVFDLSPFKIRDQERVGLLRFIVHDLSNPLNIAINFADLMAEGSLGEDERAQGTQIIARQLHRIQVLLEDLSLLDQVSEDVSTNFVPVDVDILAATVVNDLQDRAVDKDISLTTTPFPDDLCQTQGIGRLIQQAIHNLVENAIKYTLVGGWVRVTVYTRADWLDVLVVDNGIGISPEIQSKLFQPFYRGRDPRTAEIDGTGLGLSLVQMVAERHGGSVWVFSVPDKGTIFRLRLPCHREV